MTDAELAAIEARANAASPGPWTNMYVGGGSIVKETAGHEVLTAYRYGVSRENGDFVAAAREDVPRLSAEVRRLNAENEHLHSRWDDLVAETNEHVRVAREGRDAADAKAKESVQQEMAALRAENARIKAAVEQLRREATLKQAELERLRIEIGADEDYIERDDPPPLS